MRTLITVFILFTVNIIPAFAETNTFAQQAVLEQWEKTMKFGISQQRLDVIKAIEKNKSKEAYKLIENALVNDNNDGVKKEAAYALIRLAISNQTVWMAALNNEKSTDVLRAVVFGVSEMNVVQAGPKLYELLTNTLPKEKEGFLTANIIRAIGEIKYAKANVLIFSILTNYMYSEEIRGASAIAIGDIGTKEHIKQLEFLVKNPGEMKSVRMYAAFAMGKSGDPSMIDILIPIIEDEKNDINIRVYAIAGLAYIKDAKIVDKMMQLANVDTVRIRIEAVKALGKLKDAKAKELLIFKAFNDPDYTVKKEAKLALQAMGEDLVKLGLEKAPPEPTPNQVLPGSQTSPQVTPAPKSNPQVTPAPKDNSKAAEPGNNSITLAPQVMPAVTAPAAETDDTKKLDF
ncbi:MAG: hypothetical protein A2Y33_10460 [Spirochaetes bacterium GWF1_51_8]|nr:MAG: hypothetical protein A2Y33_10460 [Spirochaetes bacterium GWF1_51_8]